MDTGSLRPTVVEVSLARLAENYRAIQAAVKSCGLPEGVFSLLLGGIETGEMLVRDPRMRAVGFTGSRVQKHPLPLKTSANKPAAIKRAFIVQR